MFANLVDGLKIQKDGMKEQLNSKDLQFERVGYTHDPRFLEGFNRRWLVLTADGKIPFLIFG
ncbi:MAG TPA: hypothetical protein VFO70_00065 [Chitinophagaceae bacterium]|nr:hypothetical protein [Chitinophagaceae bacterium]